VSVFVVVAALALVAASPFFELAAVIESPAFVIARPALLAENCAVANFLRASFSAAVYSSFLAFF